MNFYDEFKVRHAHLVKDRIAQNTGIINDTVEPPECVERRFDDGISLQRLGYGVEIGDGRTASFADFIDDFFRWRRAAAVAVGGAAKVIHDDLRALGRSEQCNLAANAAAG